MTTIFVNTKRIDGKSIHYPMCEISSLLSQLGKEDECVVFRFTSQDLRIISALGFKIEYVSDGNTEEYDFDRTEYLMPKKTENKPYQKKEFKFRGGF